MSVARAALRWDARRKCRWLLSGGIGTARCGPLLDIGTGSGLLAASLRRAGWQVVQVDVADWAFDRRWPPLLYDGARLPYQSREFAVALLSTVLHHASDPRRLLAEAVRVARTVVLVEDVYTTTTQRGLTMMADRVANLSFRHHPHQNRTTAGWQAMAADLSLATVRCEERRFLLLFRQLLLVLDSR